MKNRTMIIIAVCALCLFFIIFIFLSLELRSSAKNDNMWFQSLHASAESADDSRNGLVNLNTADFSELIRVEGVSRELAHNIIYYRESGGIFFRVEQLLLVEGVNEELYEEIKQYFCTYDDISASVNSFYDGAVININTASARELATLPYIGKELALAIIAYREEHGDFSSAEEIMQVKGIGEGVFRYIRDRITV